MVQDPQSPPPDKDDITYQLERMLASLDFHVGICGIWGGIWGRTTVKARKLRMYAKNSTILGS
ncbi:MAG: hypothetical protein V3V39_08335 [Desulfobacterales bacterium]|jgi:hypothetical protein